MEIFLDISKICFLAFAIVMCAAGLKGALFHHGVGPFELVGMLWRGEIRPQTMKR